MSQPSTSKSSVNPSVWTRLKQSIYAVPLSGVLMTAIGALLVTSLLMVASASIPQASNATSAWQYLSVFQRHLTFIIMGLAAGYIAYHIPLRWFYNLILQFFMLVFCALLLFTTLILGNEVKGATRWINIAGFSFQPVELTKLVMIIFVSDFVVRRGFEVRKGWDGFIRILGVVVILTLLLLAQPDFGSLVVIMTTVLVMFYVAGAPHRQFVALAVAAIGLAIAAVMFSDYRLERLTSFWNPFDDVSDSDYQLANSLTAMARGEITGVGYGESMHKLSHLPEAHNDFLFAITGEELGFIGVCTVILLEAVIVACAMRISYLAIAKRQLRMGYTAFGIGVLILGQVLINAGMNMGLMPTKGLTMPFFSYGGSATIMSMVMAAVLLSIYKNIPLINDKECRDF